MDFRASSGLARGVSRARRIVDPLGNKGAASRAVLLACTALVVTPILHIAGPACAQNATWQTNPGSGDFFDGSNWTPGSVPTGTATFGTSSTTALTLGSSATFDGWTLAAGASNYTFTVSASTTQSFMGTGISINGGAATITNIGSLEFRNSSTAGSATITNNNALNFFETSTAGNAAITNNSALLFYGSSTAATAAITNNGGLAFLDNSTAGSAVISSIGNLNFHNSSTAGSATITNSGTLIFRDNSTAGTASITNIGVAEFRDASTAGSATITNSGTLRFLDVSSGGNAAIINQAGGTVDISGVDTSTTAGSIAGAGDFILGSNRLIVGSNDLSTEVSGVISGTGGRLEKTGSGTLTLTGANTYTGGTIITSASSSSRSTVQLGTASRAGSIQGAVNVGNWSTLAVVNADTSGTTIANNGGYVSFYNTSTAGSATITNNTAGGLSFNNASTAGSATITNDGGLSFVNASTAGSATITNNGFLQLYGTSSAGSASIVNNSLGSFSENTSAGSATITNSGALLFYDASTAGSATLINNAVGTLDFYQTSTASNAVITNNGGMSFHDSSTAGGATIINTGTVGFENASTAGNATITNNNDMFFGHSSTAGSATIANTGNLTFGGSSRAGSATIVNNGAMLFSHLSNADSATITNNATLHFVQGATAGSAALINNAGGIVSFAASNGPAMDNRLSAGSIAGAGSYILGANALTVGSNNLSTTVSGVISGTGSLVKTGTGTLTLTGANTYSGGTTISNGVLAVNGSIGGTLDILTNGRLQGSGTVGNMSVSGTIAPGNSIGTLNVAGSVTFNPGSIYAVEIDSAGQSDRIAATGAATINGGSVTVLAGVGPIKYAPQTQYTILTAGGGRTGTFGGVTSNLAFLDPTLSYDANNVYLTMTRNDTNFAAIALSRNQIAAGSGIQSLGWGNPIYDAILGSSAPQARQAFDQLSGEVHASAKTALIEDSHFIRNAANDRIRMAFDDAGATGPTSIRGNFTFWGQSFGSLSRTNGDGNAAALSRNSGGFFIGADAPAFDAWRFGAVAGYSQTSFDVRGRQSSGTSDNYHVGFYGGSTWGNFALRTGAFYAWHDISTGRDVAFIGFSDRMKGDYKAATAQMFGEFAYGFSAAGARFEPFANLAHINFSTDRFTERGGAAALTSASNATNTTFATLGLRASTAFGIGGSTFTATGMVGWRHAFGPKAPISTMRFASGGSSFAIAGAPVSRDVAIIEAGISYAMTPNATLGLSYGGQFSSGLSDQSARFNFNIKF
ncbi:MAG: autotransporter domain-containing protein [Proteobacteria bacterium]|nr:autotransporter domain-containing protein [Pseudomonadota bacterium]